jgi:hypothetical protein
MRHPRLIAISAIAAAATIGAGGLSLATPAGAGPDGTHLTAHQDLALTVIPCNSCVLRPYGFSPGAHIGEFLINHGTLTDRTGNTVGHYAFDIVGTTVSTDQPPEVQLTGTLSLPDGQITVQGLEEPPTNAGTIAITGGTGRYQQSRGELHFDDINSTTTAITVDSH